MWVLEELEIDPIAPHRTTLTASGATAVHARGQLTFPHGHSLREQLLNLIENGATRVVVDLSGVASIDSSGVGALVAGLKAARNLGGDLRLAAPTAAIVSMLSVLNLVNLLAICDSAESAFP